jgi:hypothetical protein
MIKKPKNATFKPDPRPGTPGFYKTADRRFVPHFGEIRSTLEELHRILA